MTCSCIAQIDEKLKSQGLQLSKGIFQSGDHLIVSPEIMVQKIGGGKPGKGKPCSIHPIYCPFCGLPIEKDTKG